MRWLLPDETPGIILDTHSIIQPVQWFVEELLLQLQVPALQDLDKDIVYGLLLAAMRFNRDRDLIVLELCSLPAAQQLTSAEALQLLKVAVARGYDDLWAALCRLPAAQHLGCSDVMQLLQAGLRWTSWP
jgi:hypothetical protein